ncbi:MAG: hypothetical protein AAF206_22210, partial [Bacteroidota bacterium]
MKYFTLFSLLTAFALSSCQQETPSNQIALFSDRCFRLNLNEDVPDIDQAIADRYAAYFNNGQSPVPLFRYVRADSCDIFLGLPYGSTLDKLMTGKLINQDRDLFGIETDSAIFFIKRHEFEHESVREFAVSLQEGLFYGI